MYVKRISILVHFERTFGFHKKLSFMPPVKRAEVSPGVHQRDLPTLRNDADFLLKSANRVKRKSVIFLASDVVFWNNFGERRFVMRVKVFLILLVLADLITFPVAASIAVSSFRQLPPGQSVLGFNLRSVDTGREVGGNLQYALNENDSATFNVGIFLTSDEFQNQYDVSSPPIPLAGVGLKKIGNLGPTRLNYFLHMGLRVGYVRVVSLTGKPAKSAYALTLDLPYSAGVFKPVEIFPSLFAYPYFGVSYHNTWVGIGEGSDVNLLDLESSEWLRVFSGMVGAELEISSRFGVFGAMSFGFNAPSRQAFVGVHFY